MLLHDIRKRIAFVSCDTSAGKPIVHHFCSLTRKYIVARFLQLLVTNNIQT